MGVVISFSDRPGEDWFAANWVFRQITKDVMAQHSDDSEMAAAFERAKDYGGLAIERMTPGSAKKITNAIRKVVSDILSEKIPSGILDGQEGNPRALEPEYRKALRRLLDVISEAEKHR